MDYKALAELLYPDVTTTEAELEEKYPARPLAPGACVTRFAPSPTGYLHLGGMFQVLTDMRIAHQSGGVFLLRIEDTDQKREIDNGVGVILDGISRFGVTIDEGATVDGDKGCYGPYRQRQRVDIYHAVAKRLVAEGHAYPCFCTEDELAALRARQESEKANPGYYGEYAACRSLSLDEVKAKLASGLPFVLRLRSEGNAEKRVTLHDEVRGDLDFPENTLDAVLIKSDGIPVYHFAHPVDDHFMRVTHVVRGEEWLATLPIHVQIFDYLGWEKPKYIHTATIMKYDEQTGAKRKLSKRKDPEAAVEYFFSNGYPRDAVIEYLMTLLNSNYEEWRAENPSADYTEFPFSPEKMAHSGALFDFAKLGDVCKNHVSRMTADAVYDEASEWAKRYNPEFAAVFTRDPDAARAMLAIGRGGDKPRKDIGLWSDLPAYLGFFFDEFFEPQYGDMPANMSCADILRVLGDYPALYNPDDSQDEWFARVKELAAAMGYAPDAKTFKKNPGVYPGHAGDVSMVLRVAVTGRKQSPDLCAVMKILGADKVSERLALAAKAAGSEKQ